MKSDLDYMDGKVVLTLREGVAESQDVAELNLRQVAQEITRRFGGIFFVSIEAPPKNNMERR